MGVHGSPVITKYTTDIISTIHYVLQQVSVSLLTCSAFVLSAYNSNFLSIQTGAATTASQ